jgi:hypothetical protein
MPRQHYSNTNYSDYERRYRPGQSEVKSNSSSRRDRKTVTPQSPENRRRDESAFRRLPKDVDDHVIGSGVREISRVLELQARTDPSNRSRSRRQLESPEQLRSSAYERYRSESGDANAPTAIFHGSVRDMDRPDVRHLAVPDMPASNYFSDGTSKVLRDPRWVNQRNMEETANLEDGPGRTGSRLPYGRNIAEDSSDDELLPSDSVSNVDTTITSRTYQDKRNHLVAPLSPSVGPYEASDSYRGWRNQHNVGYPRYYHEIIESPASFDRYGDDFRVERAPRRTIGSRDAKNRNTESEGRKIRNGPSYEPIRGSGSRYGKVFPGEPCLSPDKYSDSPKLSGQGKPRTPAAQSTRRETDGNHYVDQRAAGYWKDGASRGRRTSRRP